MNIYLFLLLPPDCVVVGTCVPFAGVAPFAGVVPFAGAVPFVVAAPFAGVVPFAGVAPFVVAAPFPLFSSVALLSLEYKPIHEPTGLPGKIDKINNTHIILIISLSKTTVIAFVDNIAYSDMYINNHLYFIIKFHGLNISLLIPVIFKKCPVNPESKLSPPKIGPII